MSKHWSLALAAALAVLFVMLWGVMPTGTMQASLSTGRAAQGAQLDQKELEARACGTGKEAKYDVKIDKKQHPTPEPESGKGLVYVVRSGPPYIGLQTRVAIDGKWIGSNLSYSYLFVQLDPGEHYLCSRAENKSVLPLTVEAGKTYYVRQEITQGFVRAGNIAVLLDEKKGREELAKCQPSISTEKK